MELETDVSLDELLSAGILVCVDAAPRRRRLTRRRAVTVGTAVTAAGLVTLALPKAAAAASAPQRTDPVTSFQAEYGVSSFRVLVFWDDIGVPTGFSYQWTVTGTSGTRSGTATSGDTFSTGYTLSPGESVTVTVVSQTPNLVTQTTNVTRPSS